MRLSACEYNFTSESPETAEKHIREYKREYMSQYLKGKNNRN